MDDLTRARELYSYKKLTLSNDEKAERQNFALGIARKATRAAGMPESDANVLSVLAGVSYVLDTVIGNQARVTASAPASPPASQPTKTRKLSESEITEKLKVC